MKVPIVKEHGSWAVFIFSCTAGILAGLLTHPWQTGKDFSVVMLMTIPGIVFLINAKNPFSHVIRKNARSREHLLWFLFFTLGGFALLLPFLLTGGFKKFLIFSPLILMYIIFLSFGKEHFLLTELIGFALLTLSAPITYFVITHEVSVTLYLVVFIFFAAGIFKVRARIKKYFIYRVLMIFYCIASVIFFFLLNVSVIILLPLAENIIDVLWMREEKLRTTGNIELIKGVIFTTLLGFFWR